MGCLRGILTQIGCLVVLVAAAVLGFVFRDRLMETYRGLRGRPAAPAAVRYSGPAPEGAGRAERSLQELARRGGPAYVDLTASDLAALVDAALAQAPRRVFDSVEVALLSDEVRVRGSLDVTGIPRALLGPLAGAIGPREPLVIGGPLEADQAGGVRWRVVTLRIREFPFPRGTIPSILRQLRIPGAGQGTLPLPGVAGVGDVRVSPRSVRLYRSEPR